MLPRSVPEAEGVSSNSIIQFLDAAAKSKTEFHSFMLLRHGKVIAEGWWNPYRPDLKHTLYSCSKSFTATAVGFAIQEKKVSLDDKVVAFFPNYLPDTVTTYLSDLTVKDALMMSDGQEPDPTFSVISKDTNWIKGFLSTPILHDPGTTFLYNSLGTYMLSAIIQKVTGQSTLDYLKPRLFDPLGIRGMDWETDLQGINTGGWGLRLKTEDMAKFAEFWSDQRKLITEATPFTKGRKPYAVGPIAQGYRLSSAKTGNMLQGAIVEIPALNRQVLTDNGGRFNLTGLPMGPVDLFVTYTGLKEERRTIMVGAETKQPLSFELTASDIITLDKFTVASERSYSRTTGRTSDEAVTATPGRILRSISATRRSCAGLAKECSRQIATASTASARHASAAACTLASSSFSITTPPEPMRSLTSSTREAGTGRAGFTQAR